MGITEQEAIKELQTRDEIFVAYSQATKLPYVICDQESFNDQVWVFATEEEIKAFGKKKLEDKILLMGMKYEKKDYPRFYGTLYAIGVNSVVWVDGENQIEVELTRIARQADFSQLEPKKQPLFNSTLQLSGIYFMQELRRPIKKEERTVNLREMEEELIVNLKKSEFLVAMATDPEEFYRFYKDRMLFPDAKPNAAHKALAKLEKEGKAFVFAPSKHLNLGTFSKDAALEQKLYDLGVFDYKTQSGKLLAFLQK